MPRTTYATLAQIYDKGLPAEAFVARPRQIEAVDPATGVLTLRGHGLFDGYQIELFVEGSPVYGYPSAALPAGLSASIVYEAEPVSGSSNLFRVRPVNGSAITSFADSGSGVFSLVVDRARAVNEIAIGQTAIMDDALTAHAPPIPPNPITGLYDEILVEVCAQKTAIRAAAVFGLADASYQRSLDELVRQASEHQAILARWVAGRPINVRPDDQTPTIPENGGRGAGGAYRAYEDFGGVGGCGGCAGAGLVAL